MAGGIQTLFEAFRQHYEAFKQHEEAVDNSQMVQTTVRWFKQHPDAKNIGFQTFDAERHKYHAIENVN